MLPEKKGNHGEYKHKNGRESNDGPIHEQISLPSDKTTLQTTHKDTTNSNGITNNLPESTHEYMRKTLYWKMDSKSGSARIIVSNNNTNHNDDTPRNGHSKSGLKRKRQKEYINFDEFRTTLKQISTFLPTQTREQENREQSINQIFIPKCISLTCGFIKYDFCEDNWQIHYRLPVFDIFDFECDDKIDKHIKSHTNYDLKYLTEMRSSIPQSILDFPESSTSAEWNFELTRSWFIDVHKTLLDSTKTIQIIGTLKSSLSNKNPPPQPFIQSIIERIELFTILSISELKISSQINNQGNTIDDLSHPILVSLRNGQLMDVNAFVSFSNRCKKNQICCHALIRILGYTKEIILSSILILSQNSTITENHNGEKESKIQHGNIHPFRRTAIDIADACLVDSQSIEKNNTNEKPFTHDEKEYDVKKKCKRLSELDKLTDSFTVAQTKGRQTQKQLFINDFSVSQFLNADSNAPSTQISRRPKRLIKTVMRFEAKPANTHEDHKRNSCRIGQGFNCPRCNHWLSYDVNECEECFLKCKYQAGIGVVVFKSRDEVAKEKTFEQIYNNESFETDAKNISNIKQTVHNQLKKIVSKNKEMDEPQISTPSLAPEGTPTESTTRKKIIITHRYTRCQIDPQSCDEELPQQWKKFRLQDLYGANEDNLSLLQDNLNSDKFFRLKNTRSEERKFMENERLALAVKSVEVRLKKFEKKARSKKINQSEAILLEEKEYAEELRLFKRGLRDRVGQQEHEKNDKKKYEASIESDRLVHAYMNRNRKRTQDEIEFIALETKPLRFVSEAFWKSASTKHCDDENCSLCGLTYAQTVLLDKEMKDTKNQTKSTDVFINSDMDVASPFYREISENEMLWIDNENLEEIKKRRNAIRASRSTKRNIGKEEEELRLRELKNNLIFMKRYNEGLLHFRK